MERCNYSPEILMAWQEGEAPQEADTIAAHVQSCTACQGHLQDMQGWHSSAAMLTKAIDDGVGSPDTLLALSSIRKRVALAEQSTLKNRLATWWTDLWTFHRAAIGGVVLATALGALSAPGVLWWVSKLSGDVQTVSMAAAVVESVEVEGDTRAVVYRPENSSTTLIWVEPSHAGKNHDDPNQASGTEFIEQ